MKRIFVFGSNLAGRHGAGAAKFARENHGAVYGQPVGLQGDSYAIPTKDEKIRTLSLTDIQTHVKRFLVFAESRRDEMVFDVTAIGTGLAGYKHGDIAPMFEGYPGNVHLPEEWLIYV
ncbi:MAG: A1S_2505 family phage non-structural protein [Geminicoccaceae bacterium]